MNTTLIRLVVTALVLAATRAHLDAQFASGLSVTHLETDPRGVASYDATSIHNGPGGTLLRVLQPSNPAPGMSRRFIYVLPVIP